jgi:antitoxin MazE
MEAKIIAVGNSKGIRLPKALIDECGLKEGQTLRVARSGRSIVLTPPENPRAGWDEAFQSAQAGRVRENLWGAVPVAESWDK